VGRGFHLNKREHGRNGGGKQPIPSSMPLLSSHVRMHEFT